MKHKQSSVSISKILTIFSSNSEKISAIFRPFPINSLPFQFLLSSHLEILILQLSHNSMQCQDFILQKFLPTHNFQIYLAKFGIPEIKIETIEMSQKYLIKGKFLNEELIQKELKIIDFEEVLKEKSKEVIKYLCKYHGKIVSCELEWFRDENNEFYLVDILKVTEGVVLGGKKITRSVSENMPPSKNGSRPITARPITARSIEKSFRFTPHATYNEIDLTKIMHDSSFTTPKAFKLSYEYKNKSVQTMDGPCCHEKYNLEMCREELLKEIEKKKKLIEELEKIKDESDKNILEINQVWEKKCLEISNSMAQRMYAERKKYKEMLKSGKKNNVRCNKNNKFF